MHKLLGFSLFWLAAGMLIALIVDNTFLVVCIIIVCLICGFNMFCGRPFR